MNIMQHAEQRFAPRLLFGGLPFQRRVKRIRQHRNMVGVDNDLPGDWASPRGDRLPGGGAELPVVRLSGVDRHAGGGQYGAAQNGRGTEVR